VQASEKRYEYKELKMTSLAVTDHLMLTAVTAEYQERPQDFG